MAKTTKTLLNLQIIIKKNCPLLQRSGKRAAPVDAKEEEVEDVPENEGNPEKEDDPEKEDEPDEKYVPEEKIARIEKSPFDGKFGRIVLYEANEDPNQILTNIEKQCNVGTFTEKVTNTDDEW